MRNSDYWKQRFEQLEQAQNNMGVRAFRRIERQYEQARREIEGAIARWYQRFAENNSVGMAQARKLLAGSELKELKWEVRDYIRYGRENAIDGRWIKELENASAKFHISRLEALKIQTRQSLEVLFSKQLGTVSSTMGDIFQSNYYHTVYEVQKGFGIGWDIAGLNQDQLETALSKPWAVDGYNFSERVWSDKNRLIHVLHKELTQNLLLGKAPDDVVKTIAKKFGASKSNAGRLVMTESAYFSSVAQRKAFQTLDVEEFEVVGTLDGETCSLCGAMDGKHYPTAQFEAGVTAPPFHPWCRCCTAPYFADNGEYGGARIARKEDGKQYYIPADMTYKDWKSRFVNSEGEIDAKQLASRIRNATDVLTRKIPPIPLKALETPFAHEISEIVNNAPEPFRSIIAANQDKIVFAKINAMGRAHYNPRQGIFVNLKNDYINIRGRWTTLFHEIGHNIDSIYGNPSESKNFINALRNDFKSLVNSYTGMYNISVEEAYREISNTLKNEPDEKTHILSDLFGALSNNQCVGGYRHRKEYWTSEQIIEKEAFAHFFSASTINSKIKLDAIKEVFPNAYKEFLRMAEI